MAAPAGLPTPIIRALYLILCHAILPSFPQPVLAVAWAEHSPSNILPSQAARSFITLLRGYARMLQLTECGSFLPRVIRDSRCMSGSHLLAHLSPFLSEGILAVRRCLTRLNDSPNKSAPMIGYWCTMLRARASPHAC